MTLGCRFKSAVGLASLLCGGSVLLAQESVVGQLPYACEYDAYRITSADPKGGNEDWRYLDPGKTLVLADIQGPGCIVHWRDWDDGTAGRRGSLAVLSVSC